MKTRKHNIIDITPKYQSGLRDYMLSVYNYMTLGLITTGIFAILTISNQLLLGLVYVVENDVIIGFSPIGWLISFAPIIIALIFSFGQPSMKASTAQILFWLYASLLGISISSIFLVYTGESIARIFFITASIFSAMTIYGYLTKRDLTSFGSFLIMGLIGIILASLINLFLSSTGLNFAISILGVLIFVGLTAFDTKRIKAIYNKYNPEDKEAATKIAIIGALILYLDFINIFVHLLNLLGRHKQH